MLQSPIATPEAPIRAARDCRCLVVGAGEMGRAHIAVLRALDTGAIEALAPSERNRAAVEALGAGFSAAPLADAVARFRPTHAVVAGPADTLADCTLRLIDLGLRDILVEKPAALNRCEAAALATRAAGSGARIYVGYNRRFYASVRAALAMIRASGHPIANLSFEFTEWSDVIRGLTNQSPRTLAHWLVANSLHVIDLAFLATGLPDVGRSHFVARGRLDWHPSKIFVGSGLTTDDIPFSYGANWDGPGRWGVEWVTSSTRYVFRPMEKLHTVARGSVAVTEVALEGDLDQRFKPGLYRQNQAFLSGEGREALANLDHALRLVELAHRIGGYDT
jgi:predicted dehydrogenase